MAHFEIIPRQEAADWIWVLVDDNEKRICMSWIQFDTPLKAKFDIYRIIGSINIDTKVVIIEGEHNTDSILI